MSNEKQDFICTDVDNGRIYMVIKPYGDRFYLALIKIKGKEYSADGDNRMQKIIYGNI